MNDTAPDNDTHSFWRNRVEKLGQTIRDNPQTEPTNVLKHFFSQAVDNEFPLGLSTWRTKTKEIINLAVSTMSDNIGTIRERVAYVLREFHTPMIKHIRLADIRNRIVFEIYKSKGMTIDTYFDRYSNPPGTAEQNLQYMKMAHGSALYTAAAYTQELSDLLIHIQLLKRIFLVVDIVFHRAEIPDQMHLNWITEAWTVQIRRHGMGNLVWSLFLDLFVVENSI